MPRLDRLVACSCATWRAAEVTPRAVSRETARRGSEDRCGSRNAIRQISAICVEGVLKLVPSGGDRGGDQQEGRRAQRARRPEIRERDKGFEPSTFSLGS